jgi:hypothetical protein
MLPRAQRHLGLPQNGTRGRLPQGHLGPACLQLNGRLVAEPQFSVTEAIFARTRALGRP